MLLDITGTRFYQGKLILPEEWRLDKNRPLQWWMPQGDQTIYKVVVRSLKGDILWQRPFGDDLVEALKFQHDFVCGERIGDCPSFDTAVHCAVENVCLFLSVGTQTWHCPDGVTPTNRLPLIYPPGDPRHDPELWEATSGSFTATNSTAADWFTGNKAPSGVSSVDYLVVAAGGGGGGNASGSSGGGGGAGGLKTSTGLAVTPGNAYTVTINTAGTGGADVSTKGGNGGTSVFSTITATGGGGGGAGGNGNGNTGGSGGGAGGNGGSTTGGSGTGSEGNAGGGNDATGSGGAGGGGSGAVGGDSPGTNGTAGGAGTSSSITGSSVTYSGGGGGGSYTGTGGAGGSGGGGNGGSGANGSNGTVNRGGGGGGSGNTVSGGGGGGSIGIIGLSFTAASAPTGWYSQFNEPSPQTFQVTY